MRGRNEREESGGSDFLGRAERNRKETRKDSLKGERGTRKTDQSEGRLEEHLQVWFLCIFFN